MEFVYKSKVIDDPKVHLVKHLRDTVLNLESTDDTRNYVIIMGKPLYSILDSEMRPLYPKVFRGIEYLEYNDEDLEVGTYCIYRKEILRKNEPVLALTPVKTLNEWFANLPLIQKREHYDSHIKIIAENLK